MGFAYRGSLNKLIMPGAMGAVVAARKRKKDRGGYQGRPLCSVASDNRKKAIENESKTAQAVRTIMNKYDTNKSGKLEEEQIIQLLTDMDNLTPAGTPPSDEELRYIIQL